MTRRFRVITATVLGALLAVALLVGAGRLLASTLAADAVPELVNYQGYLTDSGGTPVSGTVTLQFRIWDASSGGNQLWSETHTTVTVSGGYFSVLLGSQGTPLTPSVFNGTERYLEVSYGAATFARQRFASVPYALVAQQASEAVNATYAVTSTNAVTSTYAVTAAYALNAPGGGGVAWSHVVVVAKSGGDYTTINDALNAITPSASDRYLILVMPGVYEEIVTLKEYVHLKGAGIDTTVINSQANDANFNNDAAATLLAPANAQISDLTVRNDGATNDAVALKILNGNAETILDNVGIVTNGAGGGKHIGLYISTGNPVLSHLRVEVTGASGINNFNRGINSIAATPVIHDSTVAVTGLAASGLHIAGGGPLIQDSVISGTNGANGKGLTTNGSGNNVYIDRSTFAGDTGPQGGSIISTDNIFFFVGASLLKGQALANNNNFITCSQVYDENYLDLNADCQ